MESRDIKIAIDRIINSLIGETGFDDEQVRKVQKVLKERIEEELIQLWDEQEKN